MRLTSGSHSGFSDASTDPRLSRLWACTIIVIGLAAIFVLDRVTGDAPVQHLYYLPITLAAYRFGQRGSLASATAAIVLYHIANPLLVVFRYGQADLIQIVLFVAVGVVTAKLTSDANRLRVLSQTDDLTGLHNLRSFGARLAAMVRASRESKTPLSLLSLDLDRLKSLNDRHGHLTGAEAVRTVGRILADRLPREAVACRYGGDEFIIAVPRCTAAEARQIAGGLCEAVSATAPLLAGQQFLSGTLSISAGVACLSCGDPTGQAASRATDEEEGEALFRAADAALYAVKVRGGNGVSST